MRKPLNAEQQALCVKYIPLARSLAKPLKFSWPNEAEEFESAALEALVQASESFDPERNVKFATFVRYRIWGALRDVQRRLVTKGYKGDPDVMPTISSLVYDSEEMGTVLGATPDQTVEEELESRDFVEWQSRLLSRAHGAVIRLMYIEGMSQSQTADALGFSRSRISYLHHEAIVELRYHLQTRIAC
jgi:RNA polymerase sigma factor (sigma-70 family)